MPDHFCPPLKASNFPPPKPTVENVLAVAEREFRQIAAWCDESKIFSASPAFEQFTANLKKAALRGLVALQLVKEKAPASVLPRADVPTLAGTGDGETPGRVNGAPPGQLPTSLPRAMNLDACEHCWCYHRRGEKCCHCGQSPAHHPEA